MRTLAASVRHRTKPSFKLMIRLDLAAQCQHEADRAVFDSEQQITGQERTLKGPASSVELR